MTYLLLDAVFLATAVAVAVFAVRRGRVSPRLVTAAVIALAVVLVLTAIFDNIMIAVGLVAYDPGRINGLTIGLVPIEDFGYPLAAAILLPSVWALFGAPGDGGRQ